MSESGISTAVPIQEMDKKARYFYLGCIVIFGSRFVSSTLFSQLSQPILIDPGIDNTYWLFHLFGIPHLVTHSVIWSALLDILLFMLPLIASVTSHRRLYAMAFTLLVAVYQVTWSTYAMHHYHSLLGVLFLSIPFWFGPERFRIVWEAARYYFFFIFSSAALWKLSTGALWHQGQMSAILMAQHAQTIYEYPDSFLTHIHTWLIAHPGAAQLFLWAGFGTQLSFLGGFFTRRFDRVYLILFLSFFAVNYFLMQIVSLELFIFCLVLIDWDRLSEKNVQTGQ